jgi:hypothetical protein
MDDGDIDLDSISAWQYRLHKAYIQLMSKTGTDDAPANYTAWIVNPSYSNELNGWTPIWYDITGEMDADHSTAQGWAASFDCYQDITDLPEGTYLVKVKNFFCPNSFDEGWNNFTAGKADEGVQRGVIYANSQSATANNIYYYGESALSNPTDNGEDWLSKTPDDNKNVTYYYPHNRAAARARFSDASCTEYQTEFYTYVAKDGKLRLGFKNEYEQGEDWFVLSDWELFYLGPNSIHKPVIDGISHVDEDSEVVTDAIYTVDGRRVETLQPGVNIVRGHNAQGRIVTRKVYVK